MAYLMHYGRLGQRWGVQNGPPYPLGYRLPDNNGGTLKKEKKQKSGSNSVKAETAQTASAPFAGSGGLSDEELQAKVKRLTLETQYNKLSSQQVKNGEDYVKKALDNTNSAIKNLNTIADNSAKKDKKQSPD